MIISGSLLLRMWNVSDKSCRGNKNTHFVFSNFFFFENHAVYEIRWKNTVEPEGPQMAIWRMRSACWITKATHTKPHTHTHTHTHTQNLLFSTATMVARTRLSVTFHVHCLYCLFCNWHMEVSALKQVLICHYSLLKLLTQTQSIILCNFCVFRRHVTRNDLLTY